MEPVYPALAGRFLTAEPPGKSTTVDYSRKINIHIGFLFPEQKCFSKIYMYVLFIEIL